MKHERLDELMTVGQVTDLLEAHAALIGETSEEFAQSVISYVHTIQTSLAKDGPPDKAQIEALLHKIMTGMQVQDILRQQVHVIFAGLKQLSSTYVPDLGHQEEWVANCLAEIEKTYVMQSQATLHAKVLGLDLPDDDQDDDILF